MKNTRAVVIGAAAIVLTAIFFLVPFVFVFLIASKDRTESAAAGVLLAEELRPVQQHRGGSSRPATT